MLATRHAVIPALPIVLSLVVFSCGGKSGLPEPISSCPEPDSAVPDPGSVTLEQGAYSTFNVTLRNQCAETIWPAWTRTGGFDQTVLDPSFWAPLSPGERHDVRIYYGGSREIGLWGRTRCSFDEQGKGECETGDCGGFVCPFVDGEAPNDATTYDSLTGFYALYLDAPEHGGSQDGVVTRRETGGHAGEIAGHVTAKQVVTIERNSHNPTEGVWKATRKLTTHNRFYRTVEERDAALTATFQRFQSNPQCIAPQVARFQ